MKKFKKISLAYALQVFGVVMLFGYPGCSSNIKEQKVETGKENTVQKKHAGLHDGLNKAPQMRTALFSLKPEAAQINFASYLNFSR
ncbi:MAG: hypothetical protein ABIO79_07755 [Ferruginibacter sp.]